MAKKSNYEKLLLSASRRCELEFLSVLALAAYEMCLEDYFSNVPYQYMSPEGAQKITRVIDKFTEQKVVEARQAILRYAEQQLRELGRYRPVYLRVLEYLFDKPDFALLWLRYEPSRAELHRLLAAELEISVSTARDAMYYLNKVGVLK